MRIIGAMLLGLCAAIATSGTKPAEAAAPLDTLTEWTIPFPGSNPPWIALRGESVVFRDFDIAQIGRLDTQSGLVTMWPLPYLPTSPGDLKVRSTDGAVFLTAGNETEIGQFDVDTGLLRRWPLPIGGAFGPAGLALDEDGGVLFSAGTPSNDGSVIGRLDTTTGNIDIWSVPTSVALFIAPITAGPNHTVFFADSGFGPRNIARLDTTTGVFTPWAVTNQPVPYAIVANAAGHIYFQEITGSEWAFARLIPETGRVTEWLPPGIFNDKMSVLGNRVVFPSVSPTGVAVLDATQPGRESSAPSLASQTVAPTSAVVTPMVQTFVAQTAQSTVQSRTVRRRSSGAFDGWAIDTQASGAQASGIAASASPRAAYFSEGAHPIIGRITN